MSLHVVAADYASLTPEERNKDIYMQFSYNAYNDAQLLHSFEHCDGMGELPFSWNWKLLVDEMPPDFQFCEIGVYKGRVLAQVGMLAARTGRRVQLFGVTPLSSTGDKFSDYDDVDYLAAIQKNFQTCDVDPANLTLFPGFSQDARVVEDVAKHAPFDIVFIDGCHDYEIVCQDIQNYAPMVKPGGYLVMDDCALHVEHAFGSFLGHPDVSRAVTDTLDTMPDFVHLFPVGHNRVWQYRPK